MNKKLHFLVASLIVVPFLASCGNKNEQKDVIYHNISFSNKNIGCHMYDDIGGQVIDKDFEEGEIAKYKLVSDEGYKELTKDQVMFTTDGKTPFTGECSFEEATGYISVTMTSDVVIIANATPTVPEYDVIIKAEGATPYPIEIEPNKITAGKKFDKAKISLNDATKSLPESSEGNVTIKDNQGTSITKFTYTRDSSSALIAYLTISEEETAKLQGEVTITVKLDDPTPTKFNVSITDSKGNPGQFLLDGKEKGEISPGSIYEPTITIKEGILRESFELPEDSSKQQVVVAFGKSTSVIFTYTYENSYTAKLKIEASETAKITDDVTIKVKAYNRYDISVKAEGATSCPIEIDPNKITAGKKFDKAKISLNDATKSLPETSTGGNVTIKDSKGISITTFTYTRDSSSALIAYLTISEEETAKLQGEVTVTVKLGEPVPAKFNVKVVATDSKYNDDLTLDKKEITIGTQYEATVTLDASKWPTKTFGKDDTYECVTAVDSKGNNIPCGHSTMGDNVLTVTIDTTCHFLIEGDLTITVNIIEQPPENL